VFCVQTCIAVSCSSSSRGRYRTDAREASRGLNSSACVMLPVGVIPHDGVTDGLKCVIPHATIAAFQFSGIYSLWDFQSSSV